jgi:hypothetical protein
MLQQEKSGNPAPEQGKMFKDLVLETLARLVNRVRGKGQREPPHAWNVDCNDLGLVSYQKGTQSVDFINQFRP